MRKILYCLKSSLKSWSVNMFGPLCEGVGAVGNAEYCVLQYILWHEAFLRINWVLGAQTV